MKTIRSLVIALALVLSFALVACGGPQPHEHSLQYHEAVAQTANSAGRTEYSECTGCGKLFADEAAQTEISIEDTYLPVKVTAEDGFLTVLSASQDLFAGEIAGDRLVLKFFLGTSGDIEELAAGRGIGSSVRIGLNGTSASTVAFSGNGSSAQIVVEPAVGNRQTARLAEEYRTILRQEGGLELAIVSTDGVSDLFVKGQDGAYDAVLTEMSGVIAGSVRSLTFQTDENNYVSRDMPAVFSGGAFILGSVDPAADAEIITEDRLIVADVYSWTGEEYPASEYTLAFTGAEESVEYEYDQTALTLDETAHTVKALKAGTYTVTVRSENFEESFNVIAKPVERTGASWDNAGYLNAARTHKNRYTGAGTDGKTTLFVGDSFFDTSFWSDFYSDCFVGMDALCCGISSTTTYDWEMFMLNGSFLTNMDPKNVVVNLGTNNFYDDKANLEETIENVQRLFMLMHENMPNAHIWYFAVAQRIYTDYASEVSALNDAMQEWCGYKDWITFIDVEGLLSEMYLRDDGVHPSIGAYKDIYMAQLEYAGCAIEKY